MNYHYSAVKMRKVSSSEYTNFIFHIHSIYTE